MSPNNERSRMFTLCVRCLNRSDHHSSSIGQAGREPLWIFAIDFALRSKTLYLSILIGPNNEYRRTDFLILLQPSSINSCFHLKNKYSCSGNIFGVFFFCSQDSHCMFYCLKSLQRFEKYTEYIFSTYFLAAHHTNNLNTCDSMKNF